MEQASNEGGDRSVKSFICCTVGSRKFGDAECRHFSIGVAALKIHPAVRMKTLLSVAPEMPSSNPMPEADTP